MCGNCSAKGRADCKYDYEGGERRTVVLRETIRQLKDENTHLRNIIDEQNRQREFEHNRDPFAGSVASPQSSPLSVHIPEYSPIGTSLSGWTPVSADHNHPMTLGYPMHPQQVFPDQAFPDQAFPDPALSGIDHQELWPLPSMPQGHLATAHLSQVNPESLIRKPNPESHPFPGQ